jgi:hypothetical protein
MAILSLSNLYFVVLIPQSVPGFKVDPLAMLRHQPKRSQGCVVLQIGVGITSYLYLFSGTIFLSFITKSLIHLQRSNSFIHCF